MPDRSETSRLDSASEPPVTEHRIDSLVKKTLASLLSIDANSRLKRNDVREIFASCYTTSGSRTPRVNHQRNDWEHCIPWIFEVGATVRMHIQIELSALPDALIRNRSAGRSRRNNQPYRSVHRNPPRILAIVPEPLGLPRLMEIPGEKLVKTQSLCIRIDAECRAILTVVLANDASTLLPFAPPGHFWI